MGSLSTLRFSYNNPTSVISAQFVLKNGTGPTNLSCLRAEHKLIENSKCSIFVIFVWELCQNWVFLATTWCH